MQQYRPSFCSPNTNYFLTPRPLHCLLHLKYPSTFKHGLHLHVLVFALIHESRSWICHHHWKLQTPILALPVPLSCFVFLQVTITFNITTYLFCFLSPLAHKILSFLRGPEFFLQFCSSLSSISRTMTVHNKYLLNKWVSYTFCLI